MPAIDRLAKHGIGGAIIGLILLFTIGNTTSGKENRIERRSAPMLFLSGAVSAQSSTDAWSPSQVLEPAQLAARLSEAGGQKPLVLHVGPTVLFRSAHVPNAKHLGPAGQAAALKNLQAEVRALPKDSEIVLYCGCCPWADCPNIRPAFKAVQEMGFTNLKILLIPHNFKQDWTEKGFPVQKGE